MTFRPCRLEKWSENDWNTNAIQRHIKWAQTTSSRGAHSGQRSRWPICLATAASLAAMPRHCESEFKLYGRDLKVGTRSCRESARNI
jgi:hypothetical protein